MDTPSHPSITLSAEQHIENGVVYTDDVARQRAIAYDMLREFSAKRAAYYRDGSKINLKKLLGKDVIMFAARGVATAEEFVLEAFRACESSSEETVMGNLWQALIAAISSDTLDTGDMMTVRDGALYVCELKSQVNTTNSASFPQELRELKDKCETQRRFKRASNQRVPLPAFCGAAPQQGHRRDTHRYQPDERDQANRDIAGFQYRYLTGAAFWQWLTGFDSVEGLIDDVSRIEIGDVPPGASRVHRPAAGRDAPRPSRRTPPWRHHERRPTAQAAALLVRGPRHIPPENRRSHAGNHRTAGACHVSSLVEAVAGMAKIGESLVGLVPVHVPDNRHAPMASPSATGTALPICLYISATFPQMRQSSGKPWTRLYSSHRKRAIFRRMAQIRRRHRRGGDQRRRRAIESYAPIKSRSCRPTAQSAFPMASRCTATGRSFQYSPSLSILKYLRRFSGKSVCCMGRAFKSPHGLAERFPRRKSVLPIALVSGRQIGGLTLPTLSDKHNAFPNLRRAEIRSVVQIEAHGIPRLLQFAKNHVQRAPL